MAVPVLEIMDGSLCGLMVETKLNKVASKTEASVIA
jgi:hypothetical protein